MNDEPYVEELRLLLAHGEPLAPKAANLRPLLPRIIQRLAAGAPRKVIVEQLNRAGLDLSLHDLAKQLQRYRKAQRAVISHSPHSPHSLHPTAPTSRIDPSQKCVHLCAGHRSSVCSWATKPYRKPSRSSQNPKHGSRPRCTAS